MGVPRKKEHGLQHERGPHQTPHAGFEWPQFGAFSRGSALAFEKKKKKQERKRKKKERQEAGGDLLSNSQGRVAE